MTSRAHHGEAFFYAFDQPYTEIPNTFRVWPALIQHAFSGRHFHTTHIQLVIGRGVMIKASHRVAIYLRVSTLDQTTANQERELRDVAARMGCEVVKIYRDHGVSGAKGRDERPQFDRLCHDATQRQFDAIMAWSVDRLGRSLQDLVEFLSEIHALKVDLYLHQQGLDTTTPAGKAMFQMMGVFAEFERAMIQERVRAGLARAKAEGKRLGRPKVDDKTENAIRKALGRKDRPGILKIARELGVGTSTVQRIAAEHRG